MTIIWCMVPEIWSMADRIFCHFGLCFPFYPPKNLKNQNFEKMKKRPGDIIILNNCTMIICYTVPETWCVTDVIVIFHFGLFFCPFTAQKIKISKKMKKIPGDTSFYTCIPKVMIGWCTVPEILCATYLRTDRRTDRKSNI